jgi:hypothetical protein
MDKFFLQIGLEETLLTQSIKLTFVLKIYNSCSFQSLDLATSESSFLQFPARQQRVRQELAGGASSNVQVSKESSKGEESERAHYIYIYIYAHITLLTYGISFILIMTSHGLLMPCPTRGSILTSDIISNLI